MLIASIAGHVAATSSEVIGQLAWTDGRPAAQTGSVACRLAAGSDSATAAA